MRIATGILGLAFGMLIALQSCSVATLGALGSDETGTGAGSIGVLVGFLCFIGGAFGFGLPIASALSFVVAALFAFLVASDYPDMRIWGIFSLVLAALSLWTWRRSRRQNISQAPEA